MLREFTTEEKIDVIMGDVSSSLKNDAALYKLLTSLLEEVKDLRKELNDLKGELTRK